ncbi:MAG: (Fe-S)-binding protein [Christensenellales bacterium]
MSAILIAALVMSVLGLLFGALLASPVACSRCQSMKGRGAARVSPGANCGACGFPGCDGYAAAVADGKAEVGACAWAVRVRQNGRNHGRFGQCFRPYGGIRGLPGLGDHCKPKADYQGMTDCVAASLVNNGTKACQ